MLLDAGVTGLSFVNMDTAHWPSLVFTLKQLVVIESLIQSLIKCYLVKATYTGAKKTKGVRAAVYRYAERHHAYYSSFIDRYIWYDEDDLKIAVYFKHESEASAFKVFLSQWYLENSYVVKIGDIHVEAKLKVQYFRSDELNCQIRI